MLLKLIANLEQDEDEEEFIHNRNTQPETPVSCRDKHITININSYIKKIIMQ